MRRNFEQRIGKLEASTQGDEEGPLVILITNYAPGYTCRPYRDQMETADAEGRAVIYSGCKQIIIEVLPGCGDTCLKCPERLASRRAAGNA
jgi:hypothetical protein